MLDRNPEAAGVAELVAAVYAFAERLRAEYEAAAAAAQLTPGQASVLSGLDDPASMRTIADRMGCDPSNITGFVDRLADKGLVERTVDAADRRVRLVVPTEAGRAALARFQDELVRGSSLGALSAQARAALQAALRELPGPGTGS